MSLEQKVLASIVIAVIGFISGIISKIVWAWLSERKNGKSENVFLAQLEKLRLDFKKEIEDTNKLVVAELTTEINKLVSKLAKESDITDIHNKLDAHLEKINKNDQLPH